MDALGRGFGADRIAPQARPREGVSEPGAARISRRGALGAMALLACAACGRSKATARDGVRRVVSLTPNTTETLFAIGAGSVVVGRSRYCDWPVEALGLPQVGGYVDASLEAILALRPDLVTGARGPAGSALVERVAQRGIAVYFPITESIAGIEEMVRGLGERVGRAAQASGAVSSIEAELSQVDRSLRGKRRRRCLLIFGLSPIVAAGPGSFAHEMLLRAGAENVIDSGPHYPTIGMERVIAVQPEVVIDAALAEGHGVERITIDLPGWRELKAVRDGAVFAVQDNAVLRPGPRVAHGVARLASLVHGENGAR
jgi:iron complex transport system substrate-binding protein